VAKKKSKRPNLSQDTLERARAELRGDLAPAAAPTSAAPVSAKPAKRPTASPIARRIPTTDELIANYAYVLKDLRNLAILAGILLLGIIAASFLLPRITG
jgi:hypothetical protein